MANERVLNTFIELVKIDSESGDERKVADYLLEKLKSLGVEAYEDDTTAITEHTAGNVYGRIKGNTEGKQTVLLNCHMDTVAPGKNIQPIITDGVIHTDGSTILGADDKAGVAALLEVIEALQEGNIKHGDVEFVICIGEEIGLYGAKAFDGDWLTADIGYALDTGGTVGGMKTAAPGCGLIDVKITGISSHAGVAPEKGVSAITIGANALAKLTFGRIDEETTANVGTFKADGPLNVVRDEAVIALEARSFDKEKLDSLLKEIETTFTTTAIEFGGTVEIETEVSFPAFKLGDETAVVQVAKQAAKKIGRPSPTFSAGGGSDANIINGYGVPTVVLACGYEEIHTTNEKIPVEELEKLAELTLAIVDCA